MRESYSDAPEAVDIAGAERAIRRAGVQALVALALGAAAAVWLLPLAVEFPTGLAERIAFGAVAGLFVLVWVLGGMMAVSSIRRVSPADIGGSAAGPPSPRLAVAAAFLQNTLEQAVMAAGLYLALATLLEGRWLALIVVGVMFFGAGRVLFLRGYRRGVPGRALGMTLTVLPTMLGYLLAFGLVLARLF